MFKKLVQILTPFAEAFKAVNICIKSKGKILVKIKAIKANVKRTLS